MRQGIVSEVKSFEEDSPHPIDRCCRADSYGSRPPCGRDLIEQYDYKPWWWASGSGPEPPGSWWQWGLGWQFSNSRWPRRPL